MSLPQTLDLASFTEDLKPSEENEESFVCDDNVGNNVNPDSGGGGCCVLMVVVFKVFVVAAIALSTKKLSVGITLSASALVFLELVVTRVFTLFNICPAATEVRLDSLIGKIIEKRRYEKVEEESSLTCEARNKVPFEIEESRVSVLAEEKNVLTKEKSKCSKLKYKIVKRIVPKKLRSYKKKKVKIEEKEEVVTEKETETEEEVIEGEGEEEESVTEVSSLFSDERIESEISERDEIFLEMEEEGYGARGGITKAIVLIMIVLAGLLKGKVIAIGLIISWCLIMRVVCWKCQTSLWKKKRV